MELRLEDEQLGLVSAIRQFCDRECGSVEKRRQLTNGFTTSHNPTFAAKLAEPGWLGISLPEQHGGSGGTFLDATLVLQEITKGLAPVGGYATSLIVAKVYERFGSETQRREIIGGVARGRVESIAMSEPEAGSDVANIACRAEPCPEGWRIRGQKTWCSNAHIADHILLVARTSSSRHEGLTMFNVPTTAEGVVIRPIDTIATDEICDVYFTDCMLPRDSVVGKVDGAWAQLMAGLNMERVILAAWVLGLGDRAFADALNYVKTREQFGRPIGKNQVLAHRLADLAVELECATLLTRAAAAAVHDDDTPTSTVARLASMAKLKATEVAKQVALDGVQMMGGYGVASEFDMERLLRATLPATIYGGTSEIQRSIVAKSYGL